MNTPTDQLWTELFLFVFAALTWIGSFSSLKKARLIEDTPTSKIRSASQGYTEIIGTCAYHPDEGPVTAKLTGTPCVWYSYTIEKYQSNGKNSSWRTIESNSSERPIPINDGTGTCFIYPQKADVTPSLSKVWYGNSRYPSSGSSSGLFSRRYRYTEKRIHVEQLLYALGHFESLHPPSAEVQTKSAMNALINHWKQDYDALVARFDKDGNGEIDLKEWDAVRASAQRVAAKQVLENYDHTAINLMTYSPVRGQPFLLSTSDPKALSRRYRWQFAGLGALAIGFTLAFIYLILNGR